MSHSEYILGTRGSALALTQSRLAAESVTELYAKHQPGGEPAESVSFELRTVKTEGDVLTGPLATLGGTGVFAAALRQRLLDGADAPAEQRVDMAVHSLKDLPSAPCPGLVVAATLKREDPRDALVAASPSTPCRRAPAWAPARRAEPPSCGPCDPTSRSWISAVTWAPASAA